LALFQAEYTASLLRDKGFDCEIVVLKTSGDLNQKDPIAELGQQGVFTHTLEQALLDHRIDVAVHSHKDLPTTQAKGLVIAAVSQRVNPKDVLICRRSSVDRSKALELKENAVVGTSSARRAMQITASRPDIEIQDLRGNVPTRIEKLIEGKYDAILLAAAGLERLEAFENELKHPDLQYFLLEESKFIPAPAQGVIAWECRRGDHQSLSALEQIHVEESKMTVRAERKLLYNLRAGCHAPVAAHASIRDGIIDFRVCVQDESESFPRFLRIRNPDPEVVVVEAMRRLRRSVPSSVFISRELGEESVFGRAMKAHGISCRAESLIDFEPNSFEIPAATKWIFFNSRTAVQYGQQALEADCKFAVIGQGTAKALRKKGVDPDFVVDPLNMEESALEFVKTVGTELVFFPGAEQSMRSIQKLAANLNFAEASSYTNTIRENIQLEPTELVIITSPLNARAYIESHPNRVRKQYIAIGSSTQKALYELGVRRCYVASRPSEMALVEAVFSA
jgi:hydroxymethylbilane synthase